MCYSTQYSSGLKLFLKSFFSWQWIEAEDLERNEVGDCKYHEAWKRLCDSDGILVPGGFGERGVEGKIAAIEWARQKNKPFLGKCSLIATILFL